MPEEQVILKSFDERMQFQEWLILNYKHPYTIDSLIEVAIYRGDLSRPKDTFKFLGPEMESAYRKFKKNA